MSIHPDCQGTERDGLVYCDECGKPRQALINILGRPRKQWIMCDCMIDKQTTAEQEMRMRMQREKIERLRVIGMPKLEMKNQTFENDNGSHAEAMKICREFVNKFDEVYDKGTTLLLYGPTGTGKTYAANSVANALIDKGIPVLTTTFGSLANQVMATTFEERMSFYSSLNHYPLIVIDDFGAERNTEFMEELIFRIFNDRENAKKPMLLSTNLSVDFFKNPPDDAWHRISSRLFKRCYPLKFDGEDQRKKQFIENFKTTKDILNAL